MVDSTLLHNGVGSVAGLYLAVNCDVALGDGAEPDIVIALAVPDKAAGVGGQDIPDCFFVFRHHIATCS